MNLELIHQHVEKRCEQLNITPLIVADNGSRAWGYDSANSDFDIKVLFVHPPDKYHSIWPQSDHYTDKPDDMHDYTYWDIEKFLQLIWKGNAQPYELVASPHLYYIAPGAERLIEFTKQASQDNIKRIAYHFYGLAHRTFKERIAGSGEPTMKKYLYVIRPLLHVQHIANTKQLPPLNFDLCLAQAELSDQVRTDITEILNAKKAGLLTTIEKKRYDDLDIYCLEQLDFWKSNLETFFEGPPTNLLTIRQSYDRMFRLFTK